MVVSDSRCFFAVAAEPEGTHTGYVAGYRHATFYAAGETAWCDEILVTENRRGQGSGTQLTQSFEFWARQHRCVLDSLATSEVSEAQHKVIRTESRISL